MRLKLLNGAPLHEHLDFSDNVLLEAADCDGFGAKQRSGQSADGEDTLKWRDIGSKRAPLHTGWSQPFPSGIEPKGAHEDLYFTVPGVEESSALLEYDTTNLDTTLTLDDEIPAADDYLQHSLVFHNTLLSSQVVQDEGADETVSSSSFLTTSFGTTASISSSASLVERDKLNLQVPSAMHVTPLGSIPSAQYLRTIYPQTPTPNLLCALMTKPERREVFVRKGGYKMDLWEIVVGDDTCPSFKVTFWLRPPRGLNNDKGSEQTRLLHILGQLQVGNIVLLRNIALTSFRESVYGQSLSTAIARARTSVDVLAEDGGTSVAHVSGLPASVLEALTRVKRWARLHVVGDVDITRKRKGDFAGQDNAAKRPFTSSVGDEDFPPDTMESS
ncbi:hypothetical protein OPT61_g2937 [Boeremia exigua]|uniref:Uncharacterized protein n=1 Tax=Boeremia exigua TaxID=749465 RepID=A0ACC2IJX2_9PLEO|nr:hypothetical protein OPT61_g2937 [Boeremia exigua]